MTDETMVDFKSKSMAGRPREYRNAADKQKAYRQRQKAQENQDIALFELLSVLSEREQALRNVVTYWQKKGRKVEIKIHNGIGHFLFAEIQVDGRFNQTTNELLCQYLITKKVLIPTHADWSGKYFCLEQSIDETLS